MDDKTRDAIRAAVRVNEIGRDSPYRLSFAGKGKSGASFGAAQGDMAVQPLARDTLWKILQANGVDAGRIASIIGQLSVPLNTNPLSEEDDRAVESALASSVGRDLVDQMDAQIMREVCASVDDCDRAAAEAGNDIDPACKLYMALWINMTGPPTTLKQWVAGNDVWLDSHRNRVPGPTGRVTEPMMANYLKCTDYFVAHPTNFEHMREAVSAGAAYL